MQIPEKPKAEGTLSSTSSAIRPNVLAPILFLWVSLVLSVASQAQEATALPAQAGIHSQLTQLNLGDPSQRPDPLRISDYIRRIFQDKNGHLWFGTNGDGVCRYDGKELEYFSIRQGFGGLRFEAS